MIRVPQHERENTNDTLPFVLSRSKDSERFFSNPPGSGTRVIYKRSSNARL